MLKINKLLIKLTPLILVIFCSLKFPEEEIRNQARISENIHRRAMYLQYIKKHSRTNKEKATSQQEEREDLSRPFSRQRM